MACNNPILDLVTMTPYIKFGENMSLCSQDIEGKRSFDEKSMPMTLVQICEKICVKIHS